MNIHEHIRQLLAQGYLVNSLAFGRVGQIVKIEDDPNDLWPVMIEHTNGDTGATSFLTGDKVELIEKANIWYVRNIMKDYK